MTNKQLSTTGEKELVGVSIVDTDKMHSVALLDRADRLNKLSEVSQVGLGVVLSIIKEEKAYEPEYASFDEYYKTLGRSKGDISKLLKVGNYLRGAGFLEDTVPETPYTLLYTAISVFPDKDPEYVIAAAQTNSMSEMLQNRTDDAFGSDHAHILGSETYRKCDECGKMERV